MKTCKNQSCNKDITGTHHLKKYCCDKCRDEDYNSKPENKEKLRLASRKFYESNYKSKRI